MAARYLGIDGGGTSTRMVVIDETGRIMEQARGGPSNVVVVGQAKALTALQSVWGQHYDGVVAGMAGADQPWVKAFWQESLQALSSKVWVVGDYRIAWAALTDGKPGMVMIFGTGSIAYAENDLRRHRVGGYGYKLGDVGSGIALGRAAVKAALGHLEGWGDETQLTEPVREWAKALTAEDIVHHVYDPEVDWRSVSDLARHVFGLAEAGDGQAKAILYHEQQELLQYLKACERAAQLDPEAPRGLAGGLAPFWLKRLSTEYQTHHARSLVLVDKEPSEGAARLARYWCHKE